MKLHSTWIELNLDFIQLDSNIIKFNSIPIQFNVNNWINFWIQIQLKGNGMWISGEGIENVVMNMVLDFILF
jgi:hypothetical protein